MRDFKTYGRRRTLEQYCHDEAVDYRWISKLSHLIQTPKPQSQMLSFHPYTFFSYPYYVDIDLKVLALPDEGMEESATWIPYTLDEGLARTLEFEFVNPRTDDIQFISE